MEGISMVTVIRRMEENEREEVSSFVNSVMQRQYHCNAHALPHTVIIAVHGKEVVGAISLFLSTGALFPFEKYYAVDFSSMPFQFERGRVAHFGRWTASMPGIAMGLLYSSIWYALREGCIWGISEMKPFVVRHLMKIGVCPIEIRGRPLLDLIPQEIHSYYTESPIPSLCAVALKESADCLHKRMATLSSLADIRVAL